MLEATRLTGRITQRKTTFCRAAHKVILRRRALILECMKTPPEASLKSLNSTWTVRSKIRVRKGSKNVQYLNRGHRRHTEWTKRHVCTPNRDKPEDSCSGSASNSSAIDSNSDIGQHAPSKKPFKASLKTQPYSPAGHTRHSSTCGIQRSTEDTSACNCTQTRGIYS